MSIGKILLLLISFPASLASTLVMIFNILAALGHGRPLDLIYAIPFAAVPLLWSVYAAGEK